MPNVVLITGVSRHLGGRLAAQLAADPSVDRVIGVDTLRRGPLIWSGWAAPSSSAPTSATR